jgi:hypothetical protein
MASISAASTAPRSTCTSPLGETTTKAGWEGTPYSAKTSPNGSETWGKVSPNSSTNPWKSSSSPYQATPTKLARPDHRALASSTEGASFRQVNQPGAQNHSAIGWSSIVARSRRPPPTRGRAWPCSSGVDPGAVDPAAGVDAGVVDPAAGVDAGTVAPAPGASSVSAAHDAPRVSAATTMAPRSARRRETEMCRRRLTSFTICRGSPRSLTER